MADFFRNPEKRTVLSLAVSLPALIISFFHVGNLPVDTAWIAVVLCGIPILREAAEGLITRFDITADLLVSIALTASLLIGEIFAAGEVAFIMAVGSFLEERTVERSRAGIERLVRLMPATARLVHNGAEMIIPSEQVKPGDILRVLAGETIAADGTILNGQTSVDQSVMTGESLPVDKSEGDEVLGGTVNQFGTFLMTARKVGQDSALQRMIRLVESADAKKAKIVGIAGRWAAWTVVIALLAAVITWLATGQLIRAVTVLVVFCPCALTLATPTAIIAGIGNAAKHGILVREGDALERLSAVARIAFDKTGTLTRGKPSVVDVQSVDPLLDRAALLELAAKAELNSEHPLGKAIVAHYKENSGKLPDEPESFRLTAGRGVCARIGGQEVVAGNEALFTSQGIEVPHALEQAAEKAKDNGSTVIYLAQNKIASGMIALSDTLRPDAAETIKAIGRAGVRTILLTGDTPQAALTIARATGITDVKANCLPENKMEAIQCYQEHGEPMCMIGDGINDAPALKTAHVGIAMGGIGSDIAMEASDIVLTGDDIKEIPHLILLAKKTARTIRVNIASSLALNFIAVWFAAWGILSPVTGALVHNAGSIAVVVNAVLLLRWRKR